MDDKSCYFCGEIIPEGRHVCWICEHNIMEGKNGLDILKRTKDEVPAKE